jgi:hypothetical protein
MYNVFNCPPLHFCAVLVLSFLTALAAAKAAKAATATRPSDAQLTGPRGIILAAASAALDEPVPGARGCLDILFR